MSGHALGIFIIFMFSLLVGAVCIGAYAPLSYMWNRLWQKCLIVLLIVLMALMRLLLIPFFMTGYI
jgi:hypothetical protein